LGRELYGRRLRQRLFAPLRVTAQRCSVVRVEILHFVQNGGEMQMNIIIVGALCRAQGDQSRKCLPLGKRGFAHKFLQNDRENAKWQHFCHPRASASERRISSCSHPQASTPFPRRPEQFLRRTLHWKGHKVSFPTFLPLESIK